MKTWKWSTGDTYYKSDRPAKNTISTSEPIYEYDTQQNAIKQSLEDDTFFNKNSVLTNMTNSTFSGNQNSDTRREDIDIKMAVREMVSQRGLNPFLQTSYVNDIVTRDIFLKPINTTQGRNKDTNKDTNKDEYYTNQKALRSTA